MKLFSAVCVLTVLLALVTSSRAAIMTCSYSVGASLEECIPGSIITSIPAKFDQTTTPAVSDPIEAIEVCAAVIIDCSIAINTATSAFGHNGSVQQLVSQYLLIELHNKSIHSVLCDKCLYTTECLRC